MRSPWKTPWTWKKGTGGFSIKTDPTYKLFHAYDENGSLACDPPLHLTGGIRAQEGDPLCEICIDIVKKDPSGSLLRRSRV